MTGLSHCVLCGAKQAWPVWSVEKAPLYPFRPIERIASDFGFGRLAIVECVRCGHLYNAAFDTAGADDLYSGFVLTNQPVSPSMLKAVEDVAETILRRAKPRPSVLEIGGGGGALSLQLARHAREVHLVEPSRAVTPANFAGTGVTLHNTMFPTPSLGRQTFDIVACRQVIEHIPEPAIFLAALRARLAEGGLAYLELPSAEYIRRHRSIVDFHYPHVHYYRRCDMNVLLLRAGFAILDVIDIKDGHDMAFLLSASSPSNTASMPRPPGDGLSDALMEGYRRGAQRLTEMAAPVALYGANAYSQALLGLYPDVPSFGGIFDDTPSYAAQSAYGPRTDLPIAQPNAQELHRYGAILITAYLHDQPIAKKIRAVGFSGPILTVRSSHAINQAALTSSLFQ